MPQPPLKDYVTANGTDGKSYTIFVLQITHVQSIAGDASCRVFLASGKEIEISGSKATFIASLTAP